MHTTLTIPLPGLFILLAAGAFIWTLYIYAKTNPAVSLPTRIFFITVRVLALLLILLVLFQARVRTVSNTQLSPVIAVAVDNSASMSVSDASGDRPEIIRKALQDPVFEKLAADHQIEYYSLSGVTRASKDNMDSLSFTGDLTNLTNALQTITADFGDKNLASIILLTDGAYNTGGNPNRFVAQAYVPVYPVKIGSTRPVPDISIENMTTNAFTYINTPTPVVVTLQNVGYDKINLPLTLLVNDSVYTTKIIALPSAPSETQVSIEYIAAKEGMKKLSCVVPKQPNELSIQNNSKTIYLDVLKAKLNVTIIAGTPTPDISFFKRHISTLDRYTVTTLLQTQNGQLEAGNHDLATVLRETDIFILTDFPKSSTAPSTVQLLMQQIQTQNTPVWMVYGRHFDLTKWQNFDTLLPFKHVIQRTNLEQVTPKITINGNGHPVMMGTPNGVRDWQKLPPVYTRARFTSLWPNSEILANGSNGQPLIVVRNNHEHKSAALLAYDTWRWDLLMKGVNNNDDLFGNFIQNMMRWLEVKKETDWLRILTDKQKYAYGSAIQISVDVLNKDVINDYKNEITLFLEHKDETENINIPLQNSGYSKTLHIKEPGDYRLLLNTPPIPTDKYQPAMFSIGDYSAELTNTSLQTSVLKELATLSGGQVIAPDSLAILQDLEHGSIKEISTAGIIDVWNHRLLLAAIILLLALEWFLRKRFGML